MNVTAETIMHLLDKRGAYPEECRSYGEPGYSDPDRFIIFANWNHVKRSTYEWLESHGYALEWGDEWTISYETSKAYRISPDSHGWRPSFVILDNGETLGRDEIEAGDCVDEYIDHLLNDARKADTFDIDWTKHGFVKLNEDAFESGFHPGQNDKPSDILKAAQRNDPDSDYLFSVDSVGQFDARFSIWARKSD